MNNSTPIAALRHLLLGTEKKLFLAVREKNRNRVVKKTLLMTRTIIMHRQKSISVRTVLRNTLPSGKGSTEIFILMILFMDESILAHMLNKIVAV